MYLLDTNVLSELRKLESNNCDPNVKAWFAMRSNEDVWTSVICLLEIERGILRLNRKDPTQAARLRTWYETTLIVGLQDRILPITLDVSRTCAALHTPNPRPEMDALIAATAQVHRFTLVTRNTRDFEVMGVRCVNPWDDAE